MEIKFDINSLQSIDVYNELGDFGGTLKELKDSVESLINKHGENSYIMFEAGYNNIDCKLVTQETIENHKEMLEEAEKKKEEQRKAKALRKKEKKEKNKLEQVTTIFNTINPTKSVKKGLVEIIDVHDSNYYVIALDGKIIEMTYKQSYEQTVLKRSFIKQCTIVSDVDEESLVFVLIDWYDLFCAENDYDANDYLQDYSAFIEKLKDSQVNAADAIEFVACGITELEDTI